MHNINFSHLILHVHTSLCTSDQAFLYNVEGQDRLTVYVSLPSPACVQYSIHQHHCTLFALTYCAKYFPLISILYKPSSGQLVFDKCIILLEDFDLGILKNYSATSYCTVTRETWTTSHMQNGS